MNRETAIREIKERWREVADVTLSPAKKRANRETSYICPICGHGQGGDGLTVNPKSANGTGLKCFGCGFSGDIIALLQEADHVDFNAALDRCANILGLTIDQYSFKGNARKPQNARQTAHEPAANLNKGNSKTPGEAAARPAQTVQELEPLDDYYFECVDALQKSPEAIDYLARRGISIETAKTYLIGFDRKSDPAESGHQTPRIIIPTSQTHYIGRRIDGEKQYAKMNRKGATPYIFNDTALTQGAEAVFVVEGAFDALSILEIGYTAVALNSTSNTSLLIDYLKEYPTQSTLILCMDNDKAGAEATERLADGLKQLGVRFIKADICNGHKDANEALTADRDAFIEAVESASRGTSTRPDSVLSYIDAFMQRDIARFESEIKTGFDRLDKELNGGLYSGLYAFGAVSSLGKTTFLHQCADYFAASGRDVLFFSMEQSRLELVSKSLVREIAKVKPDTTISSMAIRKGYKPPEVAAAMTRYRAAVGNRLSIIEANFNCTPSFIGDYVRRYCDQTKTRPIVILDYLQIIQPDATMNGQKREAIDATVVELKRLSRDLNLTVIAISSVNRANYLGHISFESFKESGGIEYSADVVLGLELACLDEEVFLSDKKIEEKRKRYAAAKDEIPRRVKVVCMKNRFGHATFSVPFLYDPSKDTFTDDWTEEADRNMVDQNGPRGKRY